MSRNRATDSGPELILRRALWASNLRGYRLHAKGIPGRPDIVYSRARVAIFVHGCFWHGCPAHSRPPKSNADFWAAKMARNRARDVRKADALEAAGWKVLAFWEHDLEQDVMSCVRGVASALGAKSEDLRSQEI